MNLTCSKTVTVTLPENLLRILTGMALLDGEVDVDAWVSRYVSDAVRQDLEACMDSTPDNPVFDPAKARWAVKQR